MAQHFNSISIHYSGRLHHSCIAIREFCNSIIFYNRRLAEPMFRRVSRLHICYLRSFTLYLFKSFWMWIREPIINILLFGWFIHKIIVSSNTFAMCTCLQWFNAISYILDLIRIIKVWMALIGILLTIWLLSKSKVSRWVLWLNAS